MRNDLPSRLQRLLYGGSGKLNAHERVVLDAWRAELGAPANTQLGVQLSQFWMLQRSHARKSVVFWPPRNVALPEECRFALRADVDAARATLRGADPSVLVAVTVVIGGGLLTELEFEVPPGRLGRHSTVEAMELRVDPSDPASGMGLPPTWFHGAFPESCRSSGALADRRVGPWTVFGPNSTWRIVRSAANYVVVAERSHPKTPEGRWIAVREPDGELVRLDSHGEPEASFGSSLDLALGANGSGF